MNYHCINCGKKDTKYRTVDKNTHICNSDECAASRITVPRIQLDGNKTINEIPIADLQTFLQQTITTTIENGVHKFPLKMVLLRSIIITQVLAKRHEEEFVVL